MKIKIEAFMFLILTLLMLVNVLHLPAQIISASEDDLPKTFKTPPDDAKPWVSMWWFGRITPEDITQHLKELKDKGVGGTLMIDLGAMPGVPFLSDPWRGLFRHTVNEADRLGLKTASNVTAGWPSGGPWITAENSSWMTVSSTTVIKGPQKYSAMLPEPPGKGELYMDIVVQAFPLTLQAPSMEPIITLSGNKEQLPGLLDGNYNTAWHSGESDLPWIQVDFGNPHTVDWLWVDVAGKVILEASHDGLEFVPVWNTFAPVWHNVSFEAVPATSARWFRLTVPKNSEVRDFALGTRDEVFRFAGMASKRAHSNPLGVTGTHLARQMEFVLNDLQVLSGDLPLKKADMIDLTAQCAPDGTLTWDVPEGEWKVVRIGQTTTGILCGGGFMTDYLSKAATVQNYEKALKLIIDDAGSAAGKSFRFFREDNVETKGIFNWTPLFIEEFRERCGYEPAPYMATLAGEIVESTEITDRFLADVRRTLADCIADSHYELTTTLLNERGVKFKAEAGGQHHPRLLCTDGLMNQGRIDIPEAEFWENAFWKENQFDPRNHHEDVPEGWDEQAQNVNAKQTASAAHIYGKKIAAAEAFTSLGARTHWGVSPADLLLYANIAFCEGINSLNIHGSATSGPQDGLPGKAFAAGTHFNHNITWWEMGAEPFLTYLSRCQHMLQQGLFIADVLYYNGDEVPNYVPPKHLDPSLGFGYDYDVCNTEVLLSRLSVKDGMIVLPDGISYRLLILPERPVMPLAVAEKIDELVSAGATVLGPKPVRTPGLTGYPQSEEQLKEIAEKLWDRQETGKGRILSEPTIREALEEAGIGPDFSFTTDTENALMDYIHRREGEMDIYFVINRREQKILAECTFRVNGKQPELWDPMNGDILLPTGFSETSNGTLLPLELAPYGSMFIVFRKNGNEKIGRERKKNDSSFSHLIELAGPWKVSFDTIWGGPESVQFDQLISWSVRPEEGIKYFSGTATYYKIFDLPGKIKKGQRLSIDLGEVKNVARVKLNGKDLGVVWAEPFTLDITEFVISKENSLEIKVVNLWHNRLTRDAGLPVEQRLTNTNIPLEPNSKLLDSGLLGPVNLYLAH